MIDVGYKNFIDEKEIREMIKPDSSRARWLRKEAIAGRNLIDCTQGRKTNSIIILKTGHLALSSLKYSSLLRRIKSCGIKVISEEKTAKKELIEAIKNI
jgi:extracellular matrix regulatory protein A